MFLHVKRRIYSPIKQWIFLPAQQWLKFSMLNGEFIWLQTANVHACSVANVFTCTYRRMDLSVKLWMSLFIYWSGEYIQLLNRKYNYRPNIFTYSTANESTCKKRRMNLLVEQWKYFPAVKGIFLAANGECFYLLNG